MSHLSKSDSELAQAFVARVLDMPHEHVNDYRLGYVTRRGWSRLNVVIHLSHTHASAHGEPLHIGPDTVEGWEATARYHNKRVRLCHVCSRP